MIFPNAASACYHIRLQGGCCWCTLYKHQSVRECDQCRVRINTDVVYLTAVAPYARLICVGCRFGELKRGVE